MIEKCKLCSQEIDTDINKSHFWKIHQTSIQDYYRKYYPKIDILTGEILQFKSANQYMLQDFINRNNFKEWFKKQTKQKQQDYIIELIKRYKDLKQIKYTPSYLELKSLPIFPNSIFIDELLKDKGGYYKVCESLGLISKFNRWQDYKGEPFVLDEIICDSREQNIIKFDKIQVEGLKYGDYTTKDNKVVIERKSLPDLVSSCTSGLDRFKREFDRSQKDNKYIIISVENNLNSCLAFDKWAYFRSKTKVTSEYLFHNIRNLMQEYNNIQFLFLENRGELKRIIPIILSTLDGHLFEWQILVDKKLI